MAQRVEIQLVDDIDGRVADETVKFGLDGVEYEIDLTDKNAVRLRKALTRYTTAGRRAGGRKNLGKGRTRSRGGDAERNAKIREWARSNGFPDLGTHGRVPREAITAYETAHPRR